MEDTKTISMPIVNSFVKKDEPFEAREPVLQGMHEAIERPEVLVGTTYKISPPDNISPDSLYITINDVIVEDRYYPYEVFINSKNMENFQWVVALTRVISAVFRKGGEVNFLGEELKSVFDPSGGYWKKGGVYMPSLVAEIGSVIERHLRKARAVDAVIAEDDAPVAYPAHAVLCPKCNTKALIINDGCSTCLACGDSKCS